MDEAGVRFNESLARHTTYRIGGPAKVFAVPRTHEGLLSVIESSAGEPVFVLGGGSNLLVSDEGFDGLVLSTRGLAGDIEVFSAADGVRVRVSGGFSLSSLVSRCTKEGWSGLECLAGIPGTVGGAVVMNAGAHGREMKDVVRKVEALRISSPSGGIDVFEGSALAFGYRKNDFLRPDHLVLAVELEFESADAVVVKEYVRKLLEQRKASQPVDLPSCGSVFKNPVAAGMKAWQVIERLGLRGHGIGGAVFSPKHGNFIVNLGGARAGDVRALIELAQIRCRNELGFELEPEVKLIGFPDRM